MVTAKRINSKDAWLFLKEENDSVLVDVRTPEEWESIGKPDLSAINKKVLFIPWILLPDGKQNPVFFSVLQQEIKNKATALLFICKSGARSEGASVYALAHGYTNCFNVIDGFEGDALGVRTGWRRNLLPILTGSI